MQSAHHHRRQISRSGRIRATLLVALCLCIAAIGVAVHAMATAGHSPTGGGAPLEPVAPFATRPNIVFVLTDDLSMDLLRYMPAVQQMQEDGLTFNDYFVSDSLCCPSRSSIFTGNFPHDTGVFGNDGPHGGFNVFHRRGEEQDTFALALQRAGYSTAMMGKYLNGYLSPNADVAPTYVPPGWSDWQVVGNGYPEFNYTLNDNGTLEFYGDQPSDYLTDVLARKGVDFINRSAAAGEPFFLELATFSPHHPFVPAPRDRHLYRGIQAPRGPSFDVLPTDAPHWLASHPPLTDRQLARINEVFRRRVQDVQSVDDMIDSVENALAADGLSRNTYIVFSSDNGLHAGQYRLMPGKLTAFDTDIRVPLVVVGPGVPAGVQSDAMVENIDLAKTFGQIGGTDLPSDGHSLLSLFSGSVPADWRDAILVEHHGPDLGGADPDFQQPSSGNPRTYEAMRTHDLLYVEYNDGEREFYNLKTDPFELHNLAGSLTSSQLAVLHGDLLAIEHCHNGSACWAAMHVETESVVPGPDRRRRRRRRQ
jgi:N-acetylglucosamine-6-sulfatase